MRFLSRRLTRLLQNRLERRPVTVLTGARQTGKTTLVRHLLPKLKEQESLYLNFDDPDERLRVAREPVGVLDRGYRRVVIDEVQKLPGVLDAVKLIADRGTNTRFVLLGSAQILLLKQVQETLAGRAALLELWPLSVGERAPSGGPWLMDAIIENGEESLRSFSSRPPAASRSRTLRSGANEGLQWGGYPALLSIPEDEERRAWLRDYRRTYLERDLADLGQVADLDRFAMAQDLVALRTGQLLSYSDVARDLGVAPNTLKRYIRFLEISYQVFLLPPWHRHAGKRLVKSPKIYWTDTGLVRVLGRSLGIARGALFETFLLGELLKWRSFQSDPPELYFFRTGAGAEVDFLIVGRKTVLAIEAKSSNRVTPRDARHVSALLNDSDARLPHSSVRVGLVVYPGRELHELRPNVWAVPDWMLFAPTEREWQCETRPGRKK